MRKFLFLTVALVCLLGVAMPALADTDFTFDHPVKTLFEGETMQLNLLRQNGAVETGTITYSSSAPRVASVDEGGLVTCHSKGAVTVSAVLKTSKRSYKTNMTFNVLRAVTSIEVDEKGMTVLAADDPMVETLLPPVAKDGPAPADGEEETDPESLLPVLVLQMGKDQAIRATLLPKDASNRKFELSSSDDKVAKIVGAATVRPVSLGLCVLTVSSVSNPEVYAQYRVLVTQPVKSVSLSAGSKRVGVGGTLQIDAKIEPANATITGLEWTSEQPRIASVDEYGVVTGLAKGQATIRARAVDGTKRYATILITVVQQATDITLDNTYVTVAVGSARTLRATVLPSNANDKTVEWSSSDERIAKVNASGRVTPVSAGSCVITCTSKSAPEVFATAYVVVTQPVTKVAFTEKKVSVDVDSQVRVYWTTEPYDATDSTVTLKSSDNRIATVDQDGTIHGVKRGSTTIVATANDGSGRRGSITVDVLQPVYGVHMKNDTVNIDLDTPTTLSAVLEPSDANNNNMTWTSSDERIATVTGKKNRPVVTGHAWGTVTITGVTEDGGYQTECTVNVGNYDNALMINDLYVQKNQVKMTIRNVSNMNVTKFDFLAALFDINDEPLPCNSQGGNAFFGYYAWNTLYEGDITQHGRFTFLDYIQPDIPIGRVELTITGYYCDDGYSRQIRSERQPFLSFTTEAYVGPIMIPELPDLPEKE